MPDNDYPTDAGGKRRYTDKDQADALAVLAAHGGSARAASAVTGIPEATLRAWRSGIRRPAQRQLCAESNAELAERFDGVVHEMIDIVENGLDKISPSQAAIIAGIFTDKMLVLTGQATVIHANQDDERLALFRQNYGKLHQVTDAKTVDAAPSAAPQVEQGESGSGEAGGSGS